MGDTSDSRTSSRLGGAFRFLPLAGIVRGHRREDLIGDVLAGSLVAILLVPQAMAYALLAGLPPQIGLYAALLPPVLYALFGSSRYLAVGPVAIVSLLVADGLKPMAEAGSERYVQLAIVLALIVGVLQLVMALLRAGFVTTFLSHPVIAGFTSGAAVVICVSQIEHLFGVVVDRHGHPHETIIDLVGQMDEAVPATLVISGIALVGLWLFRGPLRRFLDRSRISAVWANVLSRIGPFVVVAAGIVAVAAGDLSSHGVTVVGEIPQGLPIPGIPSVEAETLVELLPTAIAITFIGFVEAYSIATALAGKHRERISPSQELLALGAANLGGAFTGAYPTTGSFSRSAVTADAGGRSGLAAIVSSVLITFTVLLFTPLLHDLPRAVLSAIIVMAVIRLVNWRGFLQIWHYDRLDGLVALATFGSVLFIGVELGILIGAGIAFVFYLWRASRPHVAIVGRLPGSESYRNVLRHDTITSDEVAAVRVDESLTFATASALEEVLIEIVAVRPTLRALVLECVAVNHIDSTGLEALHGIDDRLAAIGVELHLCELKGPVRDRLDASGFVEVFGEHRLHASTHQAMESLGAAD